MTQFETISCYISIISLVISGIAIIFAALAAYFTYKNLKEIQNQFFEQNRGNLVFFIERSKGSEKLHSLIIKNFGMSPAKLISIKITPELDWSKIKDDISENLNFTNCKNVLIAPGKYIESTFLLYGYPESEFKIDLTYETCGKTIYYSYIIDTKYINQLLTPKIIIDNELDALKEINKSIYELSNKFL